MCSVKCDVYNVLDWLSKLLSTYILFNFLLFSIFVSLLIIIEKKSIDHECISKNNDYLGKSELSEVLIYWLVPFHGTLVLVYTLMKTSVYVDILISQINRFFFNFGMSGRIAPLITRKAVCISSLFVFLCFRVGLFYLLQFYSSLCFYIERNRNWWAKSSSLLNNVT